MAAQIVISASELDRIRQTLLPDHERPAGAGVRSTKDCKDRAQQLHAQSQGRANTWTNTLVGSRRKKAEDKRSRLDMAELEKQKIDAEEAAIQLDQRKKTIDRANKLLYDEADRMKSFHSKMMVCDVIAEREAQTALKDELKKLDGIRDDRFLEMEKQNYRKMLEREMREKETKVELSHLAAKAQKEQLADYKDKRFREIEDSMLEGELLRRKALEDLETERQAEGMRRGMAVQALQETQKANEYLKQTKAEDTLRQQREEQKIEEYAKRKEQMLELRKQKEEQVFHQKQAERCKMIDAQAKRLAEMQNNEEERIENQVKDKEASDEKKRLAKEAQLKRWQDDIQRSRGAQIQRKRDDREREKAEDAETAQFLGEWCSVLDKQEQEETEMKGVAARKLAGEHKKHTEINRRKKDEKGGDKIVAARAKKAIEADTIEFHNYAEAAIREYSEDGKNVVPLIKELRDFRKRVLD